MAVCSGAPQLDAGSRGEARGWLGSGRVMQCEQELVLPVVPTCGMNPEQDLTHELDNTAWPAMDTIFRGASTDEWWNKETLPGLLLGERKEASRCPSTRIPMRNCQT